jgi:YidC/Oxa1 family membrane protein insertase
MQKNLLSFMAICLAIILGWMWLQNQIWPPPPPRQQQAKQKDDTKKQEPDKKDAERKDDEKKEPMPPTVAEVKPAPKPVPKAEPEREPQTFTLGSAETHLQVTFTERGAGVQRLLLTRFEGADYLGKPTRQTLELIQEDPYRPSYVMYHYPDPSSEHPVLGLGEKTWESGKPEKHADGVEEIKFWTTVPGLEHIKITKTYRLGPKDYHVGLLLEFEYLKQGGDAQEQRIRYQLVGPHGLPVEGEWYATTFRKAIIGLYDGQYLWRDIDDNEDSYQISLRSGGNRVPEGSRSGNILLFAGVTNPFFAAMIVVDNVQPKADAGGVEPKNILAWARPTLETTERRGRLKTIRDDAILFAEADKVSRYLLLPHVKRHIEEAKLKAEDQVVLSYYETSDGKRVATWIRRGQSPRPFLDDITARVNSEPIDLSPGAKVAHQFLLYHGPIKARLLSQFSGEQAVDPELVDRYTDKLHLKTLADYRSPGWFGRFAQTIRFTDLLIACTKLMHMLLGVLSFFGYGLSIILLTVLVRGLMFPISKKQAQFSIKMQELAPELKKMQEKYKNDPQGRTQATMELYRKHNVHPLGGCLPIFLQLPIFLGLYYALQESIHFRLAGFLWMDNLAAPDMLLWWSESIPWISDPDSQGGFFYLGPYFNLMPIVAVVLMFIQQKMMTPPPTDEQQAIQQKTFQFMMIFMGIVFYKVASGLCIYFIASSLWGVAERQLLPKKKTGEAIVAASPNGKAPPGTKGKGKGPAKPDSNGTVQKVKNWWAEILKEAKKK